MEKTNKRNIKNIKERSILKKSLSISSFFSILKLNLAIALSILLFALIVNAGDVIVESGKLDVSSNLYVDANGKVGIGTTNPGQKLEVVGNIAVSGTVDGRDVSADGTKLDSITAGAADTTSDSWSGIVDVTMTSGKVGIGTTSPSRKLHVKDSDDNVLVVDSGASKYSSVDFYDNAVSKWGMGKNPTNDFYIDQAGVGNAITILSSNRNVGVGATNPSEKLDVAGNVKGTGFCIGTDCRTSWPSSGSALPSGSSGQTLRHDGNNWVANSLLFNDDSKIGVGTTIPSGGLHVKAPNQNIHIENSANGKLWRIESGGNNLIFTEAGVGYPLTLQAGGNVGIGETSPNSKLRVAGDVAADRFKDTANFDYYVDPAQNSYLGGTLKITGYDNPAVPSGGAGLELRYVAPADYASILAYNRATSSYKRLNFDASSFDFSNGNVGIGTTMPGAKLDVSASQRWHFPSEPGVYNMRLDHVDNGASNVQWNMVQRNANIDYNVLSFKTGNVGIGTTNPVQKLQVEGGITLSGSRHGNLWIATSCAPYASLGCEEGHCLCFDTW